MFFNEHLVHPEIWQLWFSFFVSYLVVLFALFKAIRSVLSHIIGRFYGRVR